MWNKNNHGDHYIIITQISQCSKSYKTKCNSMHNKTQREKKNENVDVTLWEEKAKVLLWTWIDVT